MTNPVFIFAPDPTLTPDNVYIAAYQILLNFEHPDPYSDPEFPGNEGHIYFDILDLDEHTSEVLWTDSWVKEHPYPRWVQVAASMISEEQARCVVRKYIVGEWHAIAFKRNNHAQYAILCDILSFRGK